MTTPQTPHSPRYENAEQERVFRTAQAHPGARAETTQDQEVAVLTLAEENLLYILQDAVAKEVADIMKARKAAHLGRLKAAAELTGASSFKVKAPWNGATIATVSLRRSNTASEGVVLNEGELLDFLEENFPDLVELEEVPEEVIPEQRIPAHTRRRLGDTWRSEILKEAELIGEDYIVKDTGEPIPGLGYKPEGDYSSFAPSYDKKAGGREGIIRALVSGQVPAIESIGDLIEGEQR